MARDSGILVVKHGETTQTYRSLAEIERTIAALQGDILALEGLGTRTRTLRFKTKSGW